jgi:hypothetical protein
MPSFMYDSRVLELPCRTNRRGGMVLYEKAYRAFYEVSADRRDVAIVIEKDSVSIRTPLMRTVREFAMNAAQAAGDFFLHASCFSVRGRAVVIAGPKKAGKTTLLLFACRPGAVAYVSNDRIRVQTRGAGYRLRGMPVIINIREGSFDFFPDVKRRLLRNGLHHRLCGEEKPDSVIPPQQIGGDGAYELSTLQFCRVMSIRPVAAAAAPIVVIPRLTHARGTFALRRMRPAAAFRQLQRSLFGARYWAVSTPVFNLQPDRPAKAALLQRQCRRFADAAPAFACDIGADLYRGRGAARKWINAIINAAG